MINAEFFVCRLRPGWDSRCPRGAVAGTLGLVGSLVLNHDEVLFSTIRIGTLGWGGSVAQPSHLVERDIHPSWRALRLMYYGENKFSPVRIIGQIVACQLLFYASLLLLVFGLGEASWRRSSAGRAFCAAKTRT